LSISGNLNKEINKVKVEKKDDFSFFHFSRVFASCRTGAATLKIVNLSIREPQVSQPSNFESEIAS